MTKCTIEGTIPSAERNKSTGNRPEIQPENWPCLGHVERISERMENNNNPTFLFTLRV